MLKSLLYKFSLAFALVALFSVTIIFTFIKLQNVDRFNNFILGQVRGDLKAYLTDYYEETGSWNQITENWDEILRNTFRRPQSKEEPAAPPPPPPDEDVDRRRMVALINQGGVVVGPAEPDYPLGSVISGDVLKNGTPVEVNGMVVGTLMTIDRKPELTADELSFVERSNQIYLEASLGAVFLAVVSGILLALNLIRPIQSLTKAVQSITAGNLEQEVNVVSQDEIGQLAQAFNKMSHEVARVNRQRRQMTADIAHDLRTPLAIIAGYIESMREGVLQPTPERLDLIYTEIEHLEHLIEDLRLLSQADSGELSMHLQWLPALPLLERAAKSHQNRVESQGITISVDTDEVLPDVQLDEARMLQIFDNLIENAMRYTPAGGQIVLRAEKAADGVRLSVNDTGVGIDPEELLNVFERFYRPDKSRSVEEGGSGLGLAIVKALVEAQGGKVNAESIPGKGTSIIMTFPNGRQAGVIE